MSSITVVDGVIGADVEEPSKIISIASIVQSLDSRGVDIRVPYACQGILPSNAPVQSRERTPMHLVIRAYPFNEIAERLNGELEVIARAAAASQNERSSVLASTDDEDDFLMA